MTIIKKTKTIRMVGNRQEIVNSEYFEISGNELNNMITKVNDGGNETNLRENLLKTSKWGEK